MKAAVLTGPQAIEVKEVPVPALKTGEIEIKVSACGVCGSDVHMWKAGRGWGGQEGDFHMGHEFCGVVTNPGDSQFKAGDRVTFWANLYCGKCDMCQAGQEQLCREVNGTNYIGFVCNGAYAEYYVGKASNAYLLPDAVSDVAACVDGVRPRREDCDDRQLHRPGDTLCHEPGGAPGDDPHRQRLLHPQGV